MGYGSSDGAAAYADALSVIHEQNEIKEIFTNI